MHPYRPVLYFVKAAANENPAYMEDISGDVARLPEGFICNPTETPKNETAESAHARLERVEQMLRFDGYIPS